MLRYEGVPKRGRGLLVFWVLVALACKAGAPAEFQVRLGDSPPSGPSVQERVEQALALRAAETGLGSVSVQWTSDSTCTVRFARVQDLERAARLIELQGVMEWRITDMDNLFRDALSAIDRALIDAGVEAGEGAAPTSALDQLLTTDTAQADTAAADTTTALNQPGPLSSLLYNGQIEGEFLVFEEDFPRVDSLIRLPEAERAIPRSIDLVWASEPRSEGARAYRPLYAVERSPVLTGDQVQDARASTARDQSIVRFTLTRSGGRRFRQVTREHVNDFMAIMLDGRVFRQPPVIRSEIGRDGQIELGTAPRQEAQDLALVLRAGALPAPLTVVAAGWVGR